MAAMANDCQKHSRACHESINSLKISRLTPHYKLPCSCLNIFISWQLMLLVQKARTYLAYQIPSLLLCVCTIVPNPSFHLSALYAFHSFISEDLVTSDLELRVSTKFRADNMPWPEGSSQQVCNPHVWQLSEPQTLEQHEHLPTAISRLPWSFMESEQSATSCRDLMLKYSHGGIMKLSSLQSRAARATNKLYPNAAPTNGPLWIQIVKVHDSNAQKSEV